MPAGVKLEGQGEHMLEIVHGQGQPPAVCEPIRDSIRGDDDAGHRHGEDDADENAHLQVAPHPNQEI